MTEQIEKSERFISYVGKEIHHHSESWEQSLHGGDSERIACSQEAPHRPGRSVSLADLDDGVKQLSAQGNEREAGDISLDNEYDYGDRDEQEERE